MTIQNTKLRSAKFLAVLYSISIIISSFFAAPAMLGNIAKAECSSAGAVVSIRFDYIRNGVQSSYSARANSEGIDDTPWGVHDNLEVDNGTTLTNIYFEVGNVQGYGDVFYPSGHYYSVDTNGQYYPGFVAASDSINSHVQVYGHAGQGCTGNTAEITVDIDPKPFDLCTVTPVTATVDPGGSTSYTINSIAQSGTNSPVTFSTSFSPNTGTPPTVTSYSNNGKVPPSTTIVNIGTTGHTTSGTYTVTFSGTVNGIVKSCSAQLVVNPAIPDFNLVISPFNRITPGPNRSLKGTDPQFKVFADCTGGFAGPITSMTATTAFTNLTATLEKTQLACGEDTMLTVTNTDSIVNDQLSKIPLPITSQSISVSGTGNL